MHFRTPKAEKRGPGKQAAAMCKIPIWPQECRNPLSGVDAWNKYNVYAGSGLPQNPFRKQFPSHLNNSIGFQNAVVSMSRNLSESVQKVGFCHFWGALVGSYGSKPTFCRTHLRDIDENRFWTQCKWRDPFYPVLVLRRICALPMGLPNPCCPVLDKIVHPSVQTFYPVLGLGCVERLLGHC